MINIRHTGIVVSDAEKSVDFYTNLLGFKVKKDLVESGEYIDNFSALKDVRVRTIKMALENGDMIELLWYETHPERPDMSRPITRIGCSHFGMKVEDLELEMIIHLNYSQLKVMLQKPGCPSTAHHNYHQMGLLKLHSVRIPMGA